MLNIAPQCVVDRQMGFQRGMALRVTSGFGSLRLRLRNSLRQFGAGNSFAYPALSNYGALRRSCTCWAKFGRPYGTGFGGFAAFFVHIAVAAPLTSDVPVGAR